MHKKDPKNVRVLTSIGNCYRKLKTYEKGIRSSALGSNIEL